MDDVAARARVGKAAIYRRWSSKAALITDALAYWRPDRAADDAPDTGTLVGDFDVLVERARRNDDEVITDDLVLRVALTAAHDRELAAALDDLVPFWGRRMVSTILRQAADRGEISADRDWSPVADVLTAMGLLRAVNGQTVDAGYVRQLIDTGDARGAPTAMTNRRCPHVLPGRRRVNVRTRACGKVFVGIIVVVVVLIVGGVIVTENGHSTTSDVAGTAAAVTPTPIAKWAKSNGDAFGDLAVEFRAAGDASASNGYAGIRSACRDSERMEVPADPLQTHT
jgi:AcrR family transcriptional regulator